MGKDNKKQKKSCVPLDEQQVERLARLIIGQTVRNIRYGTDRERKDYGTGGVPFLFSERHVSAKTFTESCRGRFRWGKGIISSRGRTTDFWRGLLPSDMPI